MERIWRQVLKRYPILYPVYDRLEYTKLSFQSIINNTDFDKFFLHVVDDYSNKKTKKWLEKQSLKHPGKMALRRTDHPMGLYGVMYQYFIKYKDSRFFLKIDNDAVVKTKNWATKLVDVLTTVKYLRIVAGIRYVQQRGNRGTMKYDHVPGKFHYHEKVGGSGIAILNNARFMRYVNNHDWCPITDNKRDVNMSCWGILQTSYGEYLRRQYKTFKIFAFYDQVVINCLDKDPITGLKMLDPIYLKYYKEIGRYEKRMKKFGSGKYGTNYVQDTLQKEKER